MFTWKLVVSLELYVLFDGGKMSIVYWTTMLNVWPTIWFPDESEVTTSFLMQLSTWDKEELDEKLANRVQVSKRAVAKVIQAFDRLMQRNEKITLALKGELDGGMKQFSAHLCCC